MHPGTPPSPESFPGLYLLLQRRSDLDPAVIGLLVMLRAEAGPSYISADEFAERLGLPSRFALARRLRRLELPPFRALHARIRVLAMLGEAGTEGASLSHLALRHGEDPASWFRLVRRVTGYSWSCLSARGLPRLVCQTALFIWGGSVMVTAEWSPDRWQA